MQHIVDYAPGVSDLGVGLEALRLSVRNAEALVSWSLLDDGGREFLSEPQRAWLWLVALCSE